MGRKRTIFTGCATALVTPFFGNEVDYNALSELIEFQLSRGVDALVLLGTTGEASCITESERRELIAFAKRKINARVPLIVGTGSNSTEVAVRYTKMAEELGADGCLVVTPYYNKASDKGLEMHYKEIAKSVKIPIILYNVPSRTGVNIPMSVYGALSKMDNIVAVKEACGNIAYISELASKYGDYFDIYSGCDELILPILSLGGKGVISVVSNIVPSYVHQLCREFSEGSREKSLELQLYLNPLIKEMFAEVNPIPIKTALSQMSLCKADFRLPLCHSTRREQISKILKKYKLA
ncbi:MAG: 4-hydroxy-tetrahydrodipicolinate synthase [Clostridia bacterium]|nr:4-hydroxy-tetrahydrodipicolinate synthase [Clostridia bacterium]